MKIKMSDLEDITVLKYLGPATSLKENVKGELRKLLAEIYSIGGDWTQVRAVQPVQQYNPYQLNPTGFGGVGYMSTNLQQAVPFKYNGIHTSIKLIQGNLFGTDEADVPGLYLFKSALEKLGECVNQIRSQGEAACNSFMPTCQYLKGILVMLLENHAYWDAKIAGEQPGEFIKNLELPDISRSDSTAQNIQNFQSQLPHQQLFAKPPVQSSGFLVAAEPVASPSPEVMGQEEPLIGIMLSF